MDEFTFNPVENPGLYGIGFANSSPWQGCGYELELAANVPGCIDEAFPEELDMYDGVDLLD